jgi:nicotinamidase-related amidase
LSGCINGGRSVQPPSINQQTEYIVPNIQRLIETFIYDTYFEAIFYSEKGSIWDYQHGYVLPKDEGFCTVSQIENLLADRNVVRVEKTTKSIFKGNQNVHTLLRNAKIEEIHLVGMDTYDCILASAYESFDLGFFTYVIEECCQVASNEERHLDALSILRCLNMTNNSLLETIDTVEV